MNAREEIKYKINEQIKNKLASLPKFMTTFDLSIDEDKFRTRLLYINHVVDFIDWMKENKQYKLSNVDDLKQITFSDINEWKRGLSYYVKKDRHGKVLLDENNVARMYPTSNATIALKVCAVKKFFACFEVTLNYNPCMNLSAPKVGEKPKVVLDDSEISNVFENIKSGVGTDRAKNYQKNYCNRDLAMVCILATTGIRVEALVNINISDVNLDTQMVTITSKGNKTSEKYLMDTTISYLKEYLKERLKVNTKSEALFISNQKRRISNRTVQAIISRYTHEINKSVSPHVFRKTFGTKIHKNTGDILLVATLLDHDNIQTAKKAYVAVDTQMLVGAVKKTNLLGNLNL